MRNLFICVQLLIGNFYIIVCEKHIISYLIYNNEELKEDLSIYNLETGILTKFDILGNITFSGKKVLSPNDSLKEVSSVLIRDSYEYLGYTCKKYRVSYNVKGSSTGVVAEKAYCDIPLINEYLDPWGENLSISYLKPTQGMPKLYTVEVYEVTHDMLQDMIENKVLISKLKFLEEREFLDSEIEKLLENL